VWQWVLKNYVGILIAAGVLLVLSLPTVLTRSRSPKPLAAGWDDLVFCLDLVSFDGKARLTLADDGVATLEEKTGDNAKTTSGSWAFSGRPNHYSITFGDTATSFERIAPPDADMCILAAGTSYAANLRQSWFAVRLEQDAPDQDRY
jgi:hypothetical protein